MFLTICFSSIDAVVFLPRPRFLFEYHNRKPMSRQKSGFDKQPGSALIPHVLFRAFPTFWDDCQCMDKHIIER
jgi:hypothetical protein